MGGFPIGYGLRGGWRPLQRGENFQSFHMSRQICRLPQRGQNEPDFRHVFFRVGVHKSFATKVRKHSFILMSK